MALFQRNIVVLIILLLSGCSSHQHKKYLGYIEGKYTYLSSKVSGHLVALSVRKGQAVNAGDLAYKLDPQPELSQYHAAKAKLEASEHQLANLRKGERSTILKQLSAKMKEATSEVAFAKKMYDRDRVLIKTNAIGQAQLDSTKNALHTAQEKLNAAKSAVAEARQGARKDEVLAQVAHVKAAKAEAAHLYWMLQQKRGHIPKSGVIENTFFREGEFVPAGKAIASLLTPENRLLVFFIPEQKRHELKIGSHVFFTCDGCKKDVKATVNFVGTQAEYTPPVVYSKDSRHKLVYYVEAKIDPDVVTQFHPGQPVQVMLKK